MQSPSPELSFNSLGSLLTFAFLLAERGRRPKACTEWFISHGKQERSRFFFSKLFLMLPNIEHSARVWKYTGPCPTVTTPVGATCFIAWMKYTEALKRIYFPFGALRNGDLGFAKSCRRDLNDLYLDKIWYRKALDLRARYVTVCVWHLCSESHPNMIISSHLILKSSGKLVQDSGHGGWDDPAPKWRWTHLSNEKRPRVLFRVCMGLYYPVGIIIDHLIIRVPLQPV